MRWQLGAKLNCYLLSMPPGTLTANLIGGYIIGFAIAYFAQAPNRVPEWRLFSLEADSGWSLQFHHVPNCH